MSHVTIYHSLYIQARSALKKELLEHLRRTRNMRRSRHHAQKTVTMAGLLTPFQSVNVLLRSKIARYLGTGGATCFSAVTTARLLRSLSARPAM